MRTWLPILFYSKTLMKIERDFFFLTSHFTMRQDSKKLGKFLGKWKGETERGKLNRVKQFEQLTASW